MPVCKEQRQFRPHGVPPRFPGLTLPHGGVDLREDRVRAIGGRGAPDHARAAINEREAAAAPERGSRPVANDQPIAGLSLRCQRRAEALSDVCRYRDDRADLAWSGHAVADDLPASAEHEGAASRRCRERAQEVRAWCAECARIQRCDCLPVVRLERGDRRVWQGWQLWPFERAAQGAPARYKTEPRVERLSCRSRIELDAARGSIG